MGKVIEIFGIKYEEEQVLLSISQAECEESLSEFIRQAWHIVEPGAEYFHNWHVDLISESLMAITDGVELDDGSKYNRLLVNVPPGMMKSLLTNVFWPAWEWGPCNMPHLRYVCASHSLDLAIRDSTKMRRLIESEWYQERWGDRVQLAKDQNQKTKFETTALGFRQAVAAGSITGARGDRVIIDDPLSVEDASSEAVRNSRKEWFLEAVPTRLNKPLESAIIVIMQRLHEEDTSGLILDKGLGYDHIMLPMRYEPSRAAPTLLGYEDPRTEEGELLFPDRFPEAVVERDEKALGPYAVAGQFQQTPEPRGGGVIKREWWKKWEGKGYPKFDYVVAAVDTAYTTKTENDCSAMTVWGIFSGGDDAALPTRQILRDGSIVFDSDRSYSHGKCSVMLAYGWADRLELHELVERIQDTMDFYSVDKLLIENKASGYSVAQELRRLYGHEDFVVQLVDPKGLDKLARVYSIQHLFAEGLIYAPEKPWAETVINQCAQFPRGKHDDIVDTVSLGIKYLRDTGLLTRQAEHVAEIESGMRLRSREERGDDPLYPI